MKFFQNIWRTQNLYIGIFLEKVDTKKVRTKIKNNRKECICNHIVCRKYPWDFLEPTFSINIIWWSGKSRRKLRSYFLLATFYHSKLSLKVAMFIILQNLCSGHLRQYRRIVNPNRCIINQFLKSKMQADFVSARWS